MTILMGQPTVYSGCMVRGLARTVTVIVAVALFAMVGFFSSLKIERSNRKVYRTRDDARVDVFDYIERFYSPRRRHSKLSYISHMGLEARATLA